MCTKSDDFLQLLKSPLTPPELLCGGLEVVLRIRQKFVSFEGLATDTTTPNNPIRDEMQLDTKDLSLLFWRKLSWASPQTPCDAHMIELQRPKTIKTRIESKSSLSGDSLFPDFTISRSHFGSRGFLWNHVSKPGKISSTASFYRGGDHFRHVIGVVLWGSILCQVIYHL